MSENNSELNGNANHNGKINYSEERKLLELRGEIEETRGELSQTIDAIQAKLNPQAIKERVTHDVREATVERAKQLAEVAKDRAHQLQEATAPVLENARETMVHLAETVQHKVQEVRGDHSSAAIATTSSTRSVDRATTVPGSPLKPIHQQVVVIFGASSGIGRETAIQFARKGAKVVVAARGEDGLKSLVESIRNFGGEAIYQVAEASEYEQVQAVATRAVGEYGTLDTWVHCAGISLYATFENTSPEEFRRVLEVNLLGQIYGAKAALPHIKKEGRGALIHISSVEGKRALPLQSAYASSKHGIIGFLDALRMELQHEKLPVFVTNVMPAGINTPFFNKARTKLGVKPQPAPPIYHPQVVAEVILHAAEHPTRDIFAGGAARMFAVMQNFSGTMMDKYLGKTMFDGQKTDELKTSDAPDGLYAPVAGFDKVGGDFADKAKSKSMMKWVETNPNANRVLKGAAVASLAFLLLRRR